MADSFQLQLVSTLLDGSSTERTKSESETVSSLNEDFWLSVKVAAGASTLLTLGSLADPQMLVVYGDEDCWVLLDATQRAHPCNPFFIVSDTDNGLNLSSLYLVNGDTQEHTFTVIAVEA